MQGRSRHPSPPLPSLWGTPASAWALELGEGACSTGVCYALELHETGSSWTLEPEIEEKEVEERSSFLEQG